MRPYATWTGRKVWLPTGPNPYAVWFGRVVWLGVLANIFLALGGLLYPAGFVELILGPYEQAAIQGGPYGAGAIGPEQLIWVRFAALLLNLLSLFYIPAAGDPYHYRANAWLAILARFAGAAFFLPQPGVYRYFGLFDLAFGVVELILLIPAYWTGREPVAPKVEPTGSPGAPAPPPASPA